MRLLPRNGTWRRCGYLLGVAASLCAYLLTAFGFPVLVPRVAKDEKRPATVATHPCGCAVVEDAPKACCCCSPQGGGASCCGGGDHAEPPEPDAPVSVGWVLGESVLRCQGLSTAWVSAGAVLPPLYPLGCRPADVCDDLPSIPGPLLVGVSKAPPSPPPRSLSV